MRSARGVGRPAAVHAARTPTAIQSSSDSTFNPVSVPPRWITVLASGSFCTTTDAVSHRSTAAPMQSNPAPRLAVDPGTRTTARRLTRATVRRNASDAW
jgi:hypothetical protein